MKNTNMLPMNLQLFAEEGIESSVNADPVVNVDPQIETPNTDTQVPQPAESANGGVATPQQTEKPVQSPEDNAKYAAIRREAEQKTYAKAQDELIASIYGESHGIYTKADYDKAVKQAQEEAEIQKQVEKGIDPEIARELQEAKRFRQQYETEKQTKAQQEKQQKDYQSFIEAYPEVKANEIPAQVWEEVNKGKSLVDAYAKHENSILKAKLAEYEKGSKVQQVNANNAATSTGSLTGNGTAIADFITFDTFEANKSDSKWVMKNFNKIQESRSKW